MRHAILLLLLAAAPLAQAQTSFGVKAGLNVATVTFEDGFEQFFEGGGIDKQPRLGLVAGVFADVALTPALSFRPEVLYVQRGFTISLSGEGLSPFGEDFDGSLTNQVDYLEVPLLLAYRIPVGQNGLAVGLEAGPTLAYKLRTGTRCSGDFEVLGCDDADMDDDGFRDYDVSGALGVTLGAGPFGVGLRLTQGLTTIDDTGDDVVAGDAADARNRSFSVTARYAFGR